MNNPPIILYDNARLHASGVVTEFLNRYNLIPKITAPLQGIRFRTVNDVLQATDGSLRNLQRLGTINGIQRLPQRWGRVLLNGGDYFEGL